MGSEAESRLGEVIDYITNEEFQVDRDEGQCCYCSICGLGPAWTLYFSWLVCINAGLIVFKVHIGLLHSSTVVAWHALSLQHEVDSKICRTGKSNSIRGLCDCIHSSYQLPSHVHAGS